MLQHRATVIPSLERSVRASRAGPARLPWRLRAPCVSEVAEERLVALQPVDSRVEELGIEEAVRLEE